MENKWINQIIDEVISQHINDRNRQIFKRIIEIYNINNYIPFICCFSKDGDLLSQWRAYANDGIGVSIGFNTEYFNIKNHLPYTMSIYNENSIGLHKVYYEKEIQLNIVSALLKNAFSMNRIDEGKIIEMAVNLKRYSFVFKNPAFLKSKSGVLFIHHRLWEIIVMIVYQLRERFLIVNLE